MDKWQKVADQHISQREEWIGLVRKVLKVYVAEAWIVLAHMCV